MINTCHLLERLQSNNTGLPMIAGLFEHILALILNQFPCGTRVIQSFLKTSLIFQGKRGLVEQGRNAIFP